MQHKNCSINEVNMPELANRRSTCIICKIALNNECTKVDKNPKYLKYRGIVCNKCFDQYYPSIDIDKE
jgi:hypothetical protein